MWLRIKALHLKSSQGNNMFLFLSYTLRNVISDCIKLLKSCHVLTEQLVAYTMENGGMIKSPMEVNNIVTAAKNIRPR